jgi:hypothetical protein
MSERKELWWPHIVGATAVASGFAALPFWTVGLPTWIATIMAVVLFPSVLTLYILVALGRF